MHDEMEIIVNTGNNAHHIIPPNLTTNPKGPSIPSTFEECKMMYSIDKGDDNNGIHK